MASLTPAPAPAPVVLKSSDCDLWPPLSDEIIRERLLAYPMWRLIPGTPATTSTASVGGDGDAKTAAAAVPPKLCRDFVCKNFQAALDALNAAGM